MKKLIITLLLSTLINSSLFGQTKEPIEVPYVAFPIKMGQGFNAIQTHCLMCHSFGYILNQGRQSKKFWRGKVDKMITHFKAPMTEKDAQETTAYLFKHYGNGKLQ